MAQPELEHNTLTDGGKPCHLRVIPARACAQPVHHSRTLSEQEEHDNQDQEKVAQEPRDAGEDRAEGLGQSAGFHYVPKIDVREPKSLDQGIKAVHLPVQLRGVEPDALSEPGDRGTQDEGEAHEEDD
jgi:hypothetical protein